MSKNLYEKNLYETVHLHNFLIGKMKKNGKLIYTLKIGDSWFKKGKEWHTINRIIDKVKYWYTELIIDKDNKIIRDISEPLPEHTERGSARYKK